MKELMDTKYAEALSAFFDGERVDAALLADSLAQPGSSALLADFAAMRANVEEDAWRPTPEFFQATAEHLHRLKVRRLWRQRISKLSLVASLAVLIGVAGFMFGSRRTGEPLGQRSTVTAPNTSAGHGSVPTPAAVASAPTPAARPSRQRPPRRVGGPPNASLRLRFGQWKPAPSAADTESERR